METEVTQRGSRARRRQLLGGAGLLFAAGAGGAALAACAPGGGGGATGAVPTPARGPQSIDVAHPQRGLRGERAQPVLRQAGQGPVYPGDADHGQLRGRPAGRGGEADRPRRRGHAPGRVLVRPPGGRLGRAGAGPEGDLPPPGRPGQAGRQVRPRPLLQAHPGRHDGGRQALRPPHARPLRDQRALLQQEPDPCRGGQRPGRRGLVDRRLRRRRPEAGQARPGPVGLQLSLGVPRVRGLLPAPVRGRVAGRGRQAQPAGLGRGPGRAGVDLQHPGQVPDHRLPLPGRR